MKTLTNNIINEDIFDLEHTLNFGKGAELNPTYVKDCKTIDDMYELIIRDVFNELDTERLKSFIIKSFVSENTNFTSIEMFMIYVNEYIRIQNRVYNKVDTQETIKYAWNKTTDLIAELYNDSLDFDDDYDL